MLGSYRACFPVFSYFSKIFLFSSFFPVFYCLSYFFSSKNFEFSGIFLHRALTDPGKPGKPRKINQFYQSQGKVGNFFFILKVVCIYFLSFLRMINFLLVYFLHVNLIEEGCFKALFYLY